jgi:hypothetical protein
VAERRADQRVQFFIVALMPPADIAGEVNACGSLEKAQIH